ncbi:hypothetical protein RFI_09946 [Reticulomyxa filosa]|uniref:Trafficking protein particle complex subunit n=1 Tax=Reticulomyxa filosa TaxID=46433 RepID=X6NME0_RETFI|nr:hypothetical protein RFI_09946 [Reticulomyxa filosa]|eukprot:ETO27186.1 hypothetical protein RFI_09946 [Reticulomyxa filosa]
MSLDNRRLGSKGDTAFANMDKISCELFVMTYGALVTQLIKDLKDIDEVNSKLEEMGYSIGCRLIDEFLSKSQTRNCKNFHTTCEMIAKVGLKMFLGVEGNIRKSTPTNNVANTSSFSTSMTTSVSTSNLGTATPSSTSDDISNCYILEIPNNPLNDFVELPSQFKNKLIYSNILCGVIRGALEMVQLKVNCKFTTCKLKDDDCDRIQIELEEILEDVFEDDD